MSAKLRAVIWMVQARVAGMPTLFVHACGAELERVGVRRWQLSFAGQHRSFTARSAPIDAAERAIEEIARQVLGENAPKAEGHQIE